MIKLGRYRHYKGQEYKVVGLVKNEETLEDMVVYEALYDNPVSRVWTRPLKEFRQEIEVGGRKVPRFEFIEE